MVPTRAYDQVLGLSFVIDPGRYDPCLARHIAEVGGLVFCEHRRVAHKSVSGLP